MEKTSVSKKEYMKEYYKRPEVKEKNRISARECMRRKRYPSKTKIKNLTSYINNIKKYPVMFPQTEFNKELTKLLKNNPKEIQEKKLKDILYDILDYKGILTPVGIIQIYNNQLWENTIEEFMRMNDYLKQEDKYILMNR
jgi:hypothetical protein